MFPVATTCPPVVRLPPDTLPVATMSPPVPKLPTFALPDTFAVPVMFAPVVVMTRTFAEAPTEVVTFPPEVAMVTLLVPFAINAPELPVMLLSNPPSPWKKFALARLPRFALPDEMLPVTVREPRVPTVVRLEVTMLELSVVPDRELAVTGATQLRTPDPLVSSV